MHALILREWNGDDAFEIGIERNHGAWETSLKQFGTKRGARGVGATFDIAWDNMGPLE
jgi:hypothetical protein